MSGDVATFDIDLEFECLTNKGRYLYAQVTKSVEVMGEWEYEDETPFYFDYNDEDMDNKTHQLEEETTPKECEEQLLDELGDDEYVTKIETCCEKFHDFPIYSEDTSFEYSDNGHNNCFQHDIHGFKIYTYGHTILLGTLKGYGLFEEAIEKIETLDELYNFIEEYKNAKSYENFNYVGNIVEMEKLQKMIKEK